MRATQKQYEKCVKLYEKSGQYAVYKYAEDKGIDEWSHCNPCEDSTPDCEDFCCLVCGTYKRGMTNQEVDALQSLRSKGYAVIVWYPDEHKLKKPRKLEDAVIQQAWEIIEILKSEESTK
jgi:hypothetical protein